MKRGRQWNDNKGPAKRKPFKQPKPTLTMVPAGPVERKFVDLVQLGVGVNTAASPTASGTWEGFSAASLCNGLQTGGGATQRIGRKIILKSIYLRITHYGAGVTGTQTGPLRVLVVYDKQTNGAFPTVAAADGAPLAYDDMTTPNNLYAADRFVTIFDKLLPPVGSASNPGAPQTVTKKAFRKVNLPVIYNNGNVGDITDISSGGLYITFCQAGLQAAASTVDYVVRTRFVDE